ncbi:hypothetical protein D3C75_322250 [compost metagenome]
MRLQRLFVAPEQGVGGQYQIMCGNGAELRLTCGSVQGQYAQIRGEARSFTLPVVQQ